MQQQDLDRVSDAALSASRALVAIAARSLAGVEDRVTLAQYRALVVLQSRGPQTLQSLAAELHVVPSTATRMADRLERKGLIARYQRDEDRRSVLHEVTPDGAEIVGAVTRARRRALRNVVKAMAPDDRERLVPALTAFAAAAGETPEDEWHLGWA